jgi:GABA(A) receptor-associated protein
MSIIEKYKEKPFVQRFKESSEIRQRFPGKIPIIVDRAHIATDMPLIQKSKYMVPGTMTLGQFIYVIRRQLTLPPEKALFVFVENTLPPSSTFMSEIYAKYSSLDGFVYMLYSGESTFGKCL